jgi:hypothetical protein
MEWKLPIHSMGALSLKIVVNSEHKGMVEVLGQGNTDDQAEERVCSLRDSSIMKYDWCNTWL